MKKFYTKKKHYKGIFFLFSLILLFIFVGCIFSYANEKIAPKLEEYSEYELKRFNTLIINKMIVKEINDTVSLEDLFYITKENDEVHTIDFNPIAVNRLLSIITSSIGRDFDALSKGNYEELNLEDNVLSSYNKDLLKRGIVFMIPSGMIINNIFLSNLGPRIPVRFGLTGDVLSTVHTKITNYGINNALVEVNADITISQRMILPFFTKNVQTTVSVPIIIKMIQGTVPNYYFNGIDKNSNIVSFPIQK